MTREELEAKLFKIISLGEYGGNCGSEFCDREDGECNHCLTEAIMKGIDEFLDQKIIIELSHEDLVDSVITPFPLEFIISSPRHSFPNDMIRMEPSKVLPEEIKDYLRAHKEQIKAKRLNK